MRFFTVIGLGQFGRAVATCLAQKGGEVVAIDRDAQRVEDIKDEVTQAVCVDSTDEAAMREIGIEDTDTAVVALGESDLEAAILTTALLDDMGVPNIIARAANDAQGRILRRVGAGKVIFPEFHMGMRVAQEIIAPNVLEHIHLSSDRSLVEIRPAAQFVGKTIRECDFRARFGVTVIAIQRRIPFVDDEGATRFRVESQDVPRPTEIIKADDVLVVVGPDSAIETLSNQE